MSTHNDKSSWAIGGALLGGLGAGFYQLPHNPLGFMASILIGLGIGLILASLLSKL